MNAERILIAVECIGDAKWFLDKGAAYARERVVFGAPIGKNQGVQLPLARAFAHMLAAEAIVCPKSQESGPKAPLSGKFDYPPLRDYP